MSDLSIPGVNSKYKTDEMIKAIMDAERIPLNRLEDRKEEYKQQKDAWQVINRTIDRFRDSAKKLYGFQNPFQNLVADSSQENALTATAGRQAEEATSAVEVIQVASADRFASASLPNDYHVPEGTYRFRVGDEEVSVKFRGGDLDSFAQAINRRGTGLLAASVVRDTFDTKVMVISSLKTGEENKLFFDDATKALALDMGMLEEAVEDSFSLTPNKTAEPGERQTVDINHALTGKQQLSVTYTVENLPKEAYSPPSPPSGPSLSPPEGVTYEGITIQNSESQVEVPPWQPPPPPPYSESKDIFSIDGNALSPISGEDTEATIVLGRNELSDFPKKLEINNGGNTNRRITVKKIAITDPEVRGDASPAHAISAASDSIIKIEGIEVRRPDNEIDDVIPGITLHVKAPSDGPVDIHIEPDRETIKNDIIAFVGSYNQLLTRINIMTDTNESIIDEIEYFTDDERKAAQDQLGIFQGDTTFMQLKNRLQQLIITPYKTSADNRLSMLNQIGISTNSSGFGGGVDQKRLRGYLEINEAKLDEVLKSDLLPAIKELFGRDSDGDLVVDSGVGYAMDQYTSYYTQTGGLIATRVSGLNERIDDTDNDIKEMEDDLERKEQQLKVKYGQMESALSTMQENSRALNNLNNSGQ